MHYITRHFTFIIQYSIVKGAFKLEILGIHKPHPLYLTRVEIENKAVCFSKCLNHWLYVKLDNMNISIASWWLAAV